VQLHQLKPIHKKKSRKKVGRGGKRGTYSGRGIKGQKSRSGRRFKPVIRELIKRYPKLKGYKFKSKVKNQKSKVVVLNLDILEKKFISGEKVTPQILLEKRMIRRIKGRMPKVKILGDGDLKKKLEIDSCVVSASAKAKIEKAGGSIKV